MTELITQLMEAREERTLLRMKPNNSASHFSTDQRCTITQAFTLENAGPSGLVVLQALLKINPNTQIVILTGYGSIANAVEAVRLGAKNYVAKPANVDDILAAFGQATAFEDSNSITTSSSDLDPPTLAQAEWEHIQRVLNDCDGNVSQAAFLLGISRRSLQRKLRKLAP